MDPRNPTLTRYGPRFDPARWTSGPVGSTDGDAGLALRAAGSRYEALDRATRFRPNALRRVSRPELVRLTGIGMVNGNGRWIEDTPAPVREFRRLGEVGAHVEFPGWPARHSRTGLGAVGQAATTPPTPSPEPRGDAWVDWLALGLLAVGLIAAGRAGEEEPRRASNPRRRPEPLDDVEPEGNSENAPEKAASLKESVGKVNAPESTAKNVGEAAADPAELQTSG